MEWIALKKNEQLIVFSPNKHCKSLCHDFVHMWVSLHYAYLTHLSTAANMQEDFSSNCDSSNSNRSTQPTRESSPSACICCISLLFKCAWVLFIVTYGTHWLLPWCSHWILHETHSQHKQACIVTLQFFIVSVTPIQETLVFFKYFVYRGIVSSLSHPRYGDISGRIWTILWNGWKFLRIPHCFK